jgi:hypothetical protein
VFQLLGCSGIALAVATVMAAPEASAADVGAALALAGSCGAASWSLWYYSRRYVGELALLRGGSAVRFSVLDFWGNRQVGRGCRAVGRGGWLGRCLGRPLPSWRLVVAGEAALAGAAPARRPQDVDVPLGSVRPMFKGVRQDEVRRVCSQTLFPVDVEGDRQYFLSARHGNVLERHHLMALLDGSLQQRLDEQREQQQ